VQPRVRAIDLLRNYKTDILPRPDFDVKDERDRQVKQAIADSILRFVGLDGDFDDSAEAAERAGLDLLTTEM
jgi:hypothetical protein